MYVVANQATVEGASDTPGYTVDPDELFPADLVAELSETAKLVPVMHPGDAPAECGYTASQKLRDFVRCRDLTCRFPGCDRAAIRCDLDHTIPFGEGGPTHASNLKCSVPNSSSAQDFWWVARQINYATATVIWTSPSGDTYVTTPRKCATVSRPVHTDRRAHRACFTVALQSTDRASD